MKMLMFDFRDTEKEFFQNNELVDFDLSFIREPLNADFNLSEEQKNETDIISVFRSSNLTDKVLKQFKNLRIIATRSYGYGHIDLDYCIEHNIAVLNVEQYGEEAVAQYAIALIIVLVRNMLPAILDMKAHKINYKHYEGKKLNNLTLGIVGCGQIGSAVAKIANFLGMKVLIHSYMQNPELDSFNQNQLIDNLLSANLDAKFSDGKVINARRTKWDIGSDIEVYEKTKEKKALFRAFFVSNCVITR